MPANHVHDLAGFFIQIIVDKKLIVFHVERWRRIGQATSHEVSE